jgi:hypothetical protein
MIYYYRVLDFTEMCSELHFTYYVAFDLLLVFFFSEVCIF